MAQDWHAKKVQGWRMIKAIVFDLGGVYFTDGTTIARQKIYKMVGVPKSTVDEVFRGRKGKEGQLYRKGKLTKAEFWRRARRKLKIDSATAEKIGRIWHSSYTPNPEMKGLVRGLRKNYKVFAFSGNIGERVEYLNKRYGLDREFDGYVYSFKERSTKYENKSYKILLARIGCGPGECLYIDDKEKFLKRAGGMGIKTIHFRNAGQLKRDLSRRGIKLKR